MSVLTAPQRGTLENTVIKARKVAETGARNALAALAVDQAEPFGHLDAGGRELRVRLRAKGRLLGDARATDGRQPLDYLSTELAYEYWHRMLFARFLEANHLLMYDGVSVTLEDVAELGPEDGYADKWSAAGAYASRMLPAIFRPEDPLLQVSFAPDDRIALESLLEKLEEAIFTADDALGWVYQFWQTERKAEINASGDKIDGARLPAVTQLFTEPYMVHFLLDNTLGAWWVARHPGEKPPVRLDYLRRLPDGQPAAGTFAGWPATTAEVTLLDPCMGSGHFVAAAFPMLARLRMHEEKISAEEATDRVLTDNLHGLELDTRCTQIAAFNLALTAWKFCGGYRPLPALNLACSGVAPTGKVEDWMRLAGTDGRLRNGMKRLYDLFQKAPELGSLIDPSTQDADMLTASFDELRPVLETVIAQEQAQHDDEQMERGVVAQGIALAGKMLAQKYTLLITNVPYLSRGKQADSLANYCDLHYKAAKGDLATVFLERMLKSAVKGGLACSVIPQNWLFLTSYKKYREWLLKNKSWSIVARLGAKSFQTPMWDFNVMLISLVNTPPSSNTSFLGIDVSKEPSAALKDDTLKISVPTEVNQAQQLRNPDARVTFDDHVHSELLNEYSKSTKGISTGDDPIFIRNFWELISFDSKWEPYQSTPSSKNTWNGFNYAIYFESGKGKLRAFAKAQKPDRHMDLRGQHIWNKKGVAIGIMSELPCSFYLGNKFDANVGMIVPLDESHLPAIWSFCSSDEFRKSVRRIDQKISVTTATLAKVPFDLAHWQKVAEDQYPNGLPLPYSDDPTQWLFHGHPEPSTAPLQVALARLLGYRWPAETDADMELAPEARAHLAAIQQYDHLTDRDGIVCLPPVNGEPAAAEALRTYLQAVYGAAYTTTTLETLLGREGAKGNLDKWLREEFFAQHCKLFQQRPFLWHIWDGRPDGFSAIVNYHQLTREGLQKLIYTYLGDWLRQCEQQVKRNESGADGRLLAAQALDRKLKAIQAGESPYDIFVRWKPLAQQPMGWEPDLNDGVRLNIRPFMEAEVLRRKPAIKWGTDRGKNPASSPWGELRDNDLHFTLAEKRAARDAAESQKKPS
ncbi:BREX-1 system adenine-specific DNA-methyltransferase PglX [Hymenobacter cellulosivorans]|uniref:site-specific DNA-methyltransferase (adenine-specific) n=1 Tax=Hymenobacter cellulosivorans TaxID=2932249 RepID=A0ABY4F2C3_9BACT|nr:BREX-1 system adenine-specific DNA-methyltransferase PglX [Hymenobacter cellulosivorans]UOQ50683.1 BREX-1 system adenine-specific DNA-methyltransferase PglX [Hymenobacter cellulosivorans]